MAESKPLNTHLLENFPFLGFTVILFQVTQYDYLIMTL